MDDDHLHTWEVVTDLYVVSRCDGCGTAKVEVGNGMALLIPPPTPWPPLQPDDPR